MSFKTRGMRGPKTLGLRAVLAGGIFLRLGRGFFARGRDRQHGIE